MNVYQRLNEIRKAVSYLKKDKEVRGKGYMAITHDAVTSAVREHLITHGVLVVPSLKTSAVKDSGSVTAKGIPIIRYEATYDVSFVNCDQPDDRVCVTIESHAMDEGDKAPGKATSYATKYAMLKVFSIETGDDEEDRKDQKAKTDASRITPRAGAREKLSEARLRAMEGHAEQIRALLQRGVDLDAAETYMKATSDTDEKIALWDMFDSKERRRLKEAGEVVRNLKQQQEHLDA